jgi:L-lactate dehydrogenase complex protein LldF
MHNTANQFIALADVAIAGKTVPEATRRGALTAYNNRKKALFREGEAHGEALRAAAAAAKRRALRHLPDLLEQAEARLIENGATVLWAEDGAEACQHVIDIARANAVTRVAKSKSMATEEVALNDALIAAGLAVVETDLGEYIIQLNDEHPSHLTAPVLHKSRDEIRQIFVDKLGMPPLESAEEMVAFVRGRMRDVFLNAEMGVSGANFVVAETGSIGLVTNEGNGRMVTTLPRIHVVVVGIEKLVATLGDYATLTQILPRSGTGQDMTVYTNLIHGPSDDGGPERMYVIFLDNGRSAIYQDPRYTEALACIRCGACLNACPVYRSVGGHAYGWVYAGPIGAVLTPLFQGLDAAKPLPNASSLCGSCKQVCPVDVDLPRMLLELRHDLVTGGQSPRTWDIGIRGWEVVAKSPALFEWAGRAARMVTTTGADRMVPNPLGDWKRYRDFPEFAPRPFRQQWRDRQKGASS